MAFDFRIDAIRQDAENGGILIEYTAGEAPLPAEPSGYGIEFASMNEVKALCDKPITAELACRCAIAFLRRTDNDLENIENGTGLTLRFDLLTAGKPLVEIV